jgi:hypothetical protein
LEKDSHRRLRDAGDAGIEIEDARRGRKCHDTGLYRARATISSRR